MRNASETDRVRALKGCPEYTMNAVVLQVRRSFPRMFHADPSEVSGPKQDNLHLTDLPGQQSRTPRDSN